MFARRAFFVLLIVVLALPSLANTPFAGAQEEPPQVNVTLTPYERNPILVPDKALAWEAGGIGRQRVVAYEGQLYMFYQGYTLGQRAGSVCLATSEDGLNWTRYEGNPVFVPDSTLAPNGVMTLAVVQDGETWMIYFSPWPANKGWYDFSGIILLATAPSPTGPWTVNTEPLLGENNVDAWDFGGPWFYTVVRSQTGYTMVYSAGEWMVGMATSEDGITWTKHDDPATTSGAFATSDPVFGAIQEAGAWDSGGVAQPTVRWSAQGWEMFYASGTTGALESTGYATSPDGITWTRVGDAPLLAAPDKRLYPETIAEINGNHYLYYGVVSESWEPEGIAVAMITYQ